VNFAAGQDRGARRDPNWAGWPWRSGKCEDELDIDPEKVGHPVRRGETYPAPSTDEVLAAATEQMRGDEVVITVDLGIAAGAFTVSAATLTDGYIRINVLTTPPSRHVLPGQDREW